MSTEKLNRGAIWGNKKKETDTHPDFTGSANVAGVEYWVNAWKRKEDAAPNAPSLSFSFKPKEDAAPKKAAAPEFEEDRIPF